MHNKAVRLVLAVNLPELFLRLRSWKNTNRLCLNVNFSVKLTFSQHAHRQTFHKSAGLTGFPPSLGDFTFIGRWAAVFNISCRKREKKRNDIFKNSSGDKDAIHQRYLPSFRQLVQILMNVHVETDD